MRNNAIVRLSALVMSVLLVIGLCSVCSFAGEQKEIYDDKYCDVLYADGVFTFVVDAERVGEILSNREFNKKALIELIPTGIYDIIETRSKNSVVEFLCTLADAGMLSHEEMLRLFNGKGDVLDQYVDPEMWEGDVAAYIRSIGGTAVNSKLRAFFTRVLTEQIDVMYFNGVNIYKGEPVWEFDHNAIQTAVLQALPSVGEVQKLSSGDEILNYHFTTEGENVNFDFGVRFVVSGNCSVINSYAAKLVNTLAYAVEDDGTIKVDLTFGKRFTDTYSEILASDKLTEEEKLNLLGLYTKDGKELVEELKNTDSEQAKIIASIISEKAGELAQTYQSKLEKLREYVIKAAGKSGTVESFTSIADCYLGDGRFVLNAYEKVSVDSFLKKVENRVKVPSEFVDYLSKDDHVVDTNLTVKIDNFYRVRYFTCSGDLLYTTFLPVGEDLSVLNGVAALSGMGEDGWLDEGTLVTVMPEKDVDLYDAHEFVGSWQYDSENHWKVCACGAKGEINAHVYDDAHDTVCNICGYERKITHIYGDWKCDGENHWKECSCGEKTEVGAHVYDDAHDAVCNICGYERKITHTYGDWKCDGENHWKECSCGEKIEVGAHVYDDAHDAVCNICGYERKITHTYGDWKYDDENHWKECACGEKIELGAHVYDGDKDDTCNICGFKRVCPPPTGYGYGWLVVAVLSMIACAGSVAVVVKRKKVSK